MARRDFIINEKGELQRPLNVNRGDIVSFHAFGSDILLCFEPPTVFGAKRIEIASGEKVTLEVNPDIPLNSTFQLYCCNDLALKCGDKNELLKAIKEGKGSKNTGGPL